ncbi:probable LRR receptor-like serine/threonine-protein kinase At3g47570 isoform X2 [Cornus florida]|uniref:probable LRR receptor-like serine/threonine-protein kinase At3g47570 isoform X2 n=1 Tax=Cornus florida TaxID=4283 RepID=UPI002897622B|nr:probable LRR receptor-like serine/threonine-protein kinase At3g47570 isoform X2 [Cornus florida]
MGVILLLFLIYSFVGCLAVTSTSFTDEYALLAFKAHITIDPTNVLATNWSKGTSFCNWVGVACSRRRQRVTALNLSNMGLRGTIPKDVGNLSFLSFFDISENSFHGHLPGELGRLRRLKSINFGFNEFSGKIPTSFRILTKLEFLLLSDNYFTGSIPRDIGYLPKLKILAISNNNISGFIPSTIFNISSLQRIELSNNNLSPSLPMDMCNNLSKLQGLYLSQNRLGGKLPISLPKCTELQEISLSFNEFTGQIPWGIGNLSKLQLLYLGGNSLTGKLPDTIFNISSLVDLDLSYNKLSGGLPKGLCHRNPRLEFTVLSQNQLGGKLPASLSKCTELRDISLSFNEFTGQMPQGIGNLSKLQVLHLSYNNFTGSIPSDIGYLRKLKVLYIRNNSISGFIPSTIFNISSLQRIGLTNNTLSGTLPVDMCNNLSKLEELHIARNQLGGKLPTSLPKCTELRDIALSYNEFTGQMPWGISNLSKLHILYLGGNSLTGELPDTIFNISSLVEFDLSYNKVSGVLPKGLCRRNPRLEVIYLSSNRLTGDISSGLSHCKALKELDLSINNFTGSMPIDINDALCGAPQFHVRKCKSPKKSRKTEILLKYVVPPIASLVIVVAFLVGLLRCKNKSRQLPIQCDLPPGVTHRRISHQEILCSTNYLCEENLIGKGGLGSVYKGIFADGMVAAVKVFNLEQQGAFKSFDAECEVLRNIRHRNLVKIISSCSNLDFKALVLQYMPNGNLDRWLYSHNYCLDIVQRLCIMIDVASAVEYLHHSCSTPVVHCDLKPSNILLDEDMVAHVSDFGIAKLLMENKSMAQTKTLGTIGYMAPEYGSAGIVSPMADVYSYGILLMETFTRKKPTEDLFQGELSLMHWVWESFPNEILEVADANLLREEEEYFAATNNCLSSLLGLALECTADLPEERVHMNYVLARLKKIKISFHESVTRNSMKPLI